MSTQVPLWPEATLGSGSESAAPTVLVASKYQLEIWEHMRTRSEHLIVEALAGTGKTVTLVAGLEHMPETRLVLTSFGKDITAELKARVPARFGARVKTLHGLGLAAIFASARPTSREPDRNKIFRHTTAAFAAVGVSPTKTVLADTTRVVSYAKGVMVSDTLSAQVVLDRFDLRLAVDGPALILDVLMRCAEDLSCFDFDDMIWLPLVRGMRMPKYDAVCIDELQDLTASQVQLCRQMVGGRLIGLGDSHQSIYQFRGADATAMSNIVAGASARTLPLNVTYRCAKAIVREANKYVPELEAAPDAPEGLVQSIALEELFSMVDPGDVILSRAGAPLAIVGAELRQRGFDVVQLGQSEGERIIDLIRRSKTHTTDALRAWLASYLERRSAEIMDTDARDALVDRIETVQGYAALFNNTAEVISHIRQTFADSIRQNSVIMATTHRFKGREAPHIFLLWDTYLRRDGPEENNLAYVAVTRAKTALYYVHGNVYGKKD